VPQVGSLKATGDPFQPYRLLDAAGASIPAVDAYFAELVACGRPATTQRSYGNGPPAVVPLPLRCRCRLGEGDPGRGAGLLSLASGRQEALPSALAPTGRPSGAGAAEAAGTEHADGQAPPGAALRPGDGGARRERAARLLRLPPRGRDRTVGQSFPLVRGARRGRVEAHHNPLEPFAGTRRAATGQSSPRTLPG